MRSRPLLLAGLVAASLLFTAACSDDGRGALGETTTSAAPATAPGSSPATTTTEFVPPLPQTTPDVSQPPDSLDDGSHVVFLVDVDVAARTVVFDLVQWFYK